MQHTRQCAHISISCFCCTYCIHGTNVAIFMLFATGIILLIPTITAMQKTARDNVDLRTIYNVHFLLRLLSCIAHCTCTRNLVLRFAIDHSRDHAPSSAVEARATRTQVNPAKARPQPEPARPALPARALNAIYLLAHAAHPLPPAIRKDVKLAFRTQ